MSSSGDSDERTWLLFFPSLRNVWAAPVEIWVEEREEDIFGFSLDSDPNCVSGLDSPLEVIFSPKSIVHDLYLSLGTVMGMLLEAILEHGFRIVCEPMQAFEL